MFCLLRAVTMVVSVAMSVSYAVMLFEGASSVDRG